MLTHEEAADLLAFAGSFDGRKPKPAAVQAWRDASARGRWTFDEAVEAIAEHYANRTEFLMPGHVTEQVRARRSIPQPLAEQRRAIEGPPPATPESVAEVMANVSRDLGWDRELDHRTVMAEFCEYCRARAGEECTRVSKRTATGRTPCRPHPARREAAELTAMDQEANR